jgi:hypothetical protein
LYVERASWSEPGAGDPAPCFRQGDLVRLTWASVKVDPPTDTVTALKLELRTETVVLLSADCDLVIREQPKRKGLLISPLRDVPKNIARDPEKMRVLRSSTVQQAGGPIPANLFYFEPSTGPYGHGVGDGVVYLENITMVGFGDLATKLAEVTHPKRVDLQERIKFHFTR